MNTPRTNSVIHDGNRLDIQNKCDDLLHYMNNCSRLVRLARQLEIELATAQTENKELHTLLSMAEDHIELKPTECHGYKCRTANCLSCYGEDAVNVALKFNQLLAARIRASNASIEGIAQKCAAALTTAKLTARVTELEDALNAVTKGEYSQLMLDLAERNGKALANGLRISTLLGDLETERARAEAELATTRAEVYAECAKICRDIDMEYASVFAEACAEAIERAAKRTP